ncbi:autotransporter-associated beta strand repeat-containing protein [Haloferula sargassicola]|uniref:autotransporter-associated beta strand repeat-containing protein n=1 Tax=Haloferula sargassicola TaxID=490096 RepID=UPI0033659F3D
MQATPLYWDGSSTTADADGGAGVWSTAAVPTNWDSEVVAGSDLPWTNGSEAVFGGVGGEVTVSGSVSAASLTFGSPGYSTVGGTINLTGTPAIDDGGHDVTIGSVLAGSAPIVKTGSGTLTLAGSNTFSGLFTISSGTVKAGINTPLGTGTSTSNGTVVSSGATLDINGRSLGNERVTISGTGVGGAGGLVNGSTTTRYAAVRYLTLAAPASIGGIGTWDVYGTGALNMGGHVLTKTGPGDFQLGSVSVTNPGNIDVQSGRFWIDGSTSLPSNANTLTIRSAATLAQSQNNVSQQYWKLAFEEGTTWHSGYRASSWRGEVTLDGDTAFDVGPEISSYATTQRVFGRIGGAGSLTKTGPGALTLSSLNDYTGGTTVNEGTLSLSLANTTTGEGTVVGPVTVNDGSLLVAANGALGSAAGSRVTEITLNGGMMQITSGGIHSVPLLKIGAGLVRTSATLPSSTSSQYYTLRDDAVVQGLPSTTGGSILGRLHLGSGNTGNTSVFEIAEGEAVDDLRIDAAITEEAPGCGITKDGPGTLVLASPSLYTGTSTIAEGTLKLAAAATLTDSPVVVEDGGCFASDTAGRTVASLTVQAGGALQLPAVAAGTTYVAGELNLESGSINIRPLIGAGTPTGTYDLITADSITGSGIPVLDLSGSFGPTRVTGSVAVNGNKLQLTITGTGAGLLWNNATAGGAAAGTWDSLLANFHDGVSNSNFQSFDSVIFDDTVAPGAEKTITLGAHLAPASVTIDNSQGDYRFDTTPGTLDGAGSLVKTGSGSLVIDGANSYAMSGPIHAGGGVIDFSGKTVGASSLLLDGGAFNNATAFIDSIDLRSGSSDALLNTTGTWTKSTAGTVTLTADSALKGPGIVSEGNLNVGNPAAPGSTGSLGIHPIEIASGASLTFARGDSSPIISSIFSGNGSLGFIGTTSGGDFSFSSPNAGFSGLVTVTNARVRVEPVGGVGSGPIALVGKSSLWVQDAFATNPVSITNSDSFWGAGDYSSGLLVLSNAQLAGPITLEGNKNYVVRSTGDLNQVNSNAITGAIGETGGPAGLSIYDGYGTSTLTIGGANTYTGPTYIGPSVDAKLTGSLAGSAVYVDYLASIGGNGVIGTGGSLVFASSSLSPILVADMSGDALTVNGDVNLGSSTKLLLDVVPSPVSGPIPVLQYTGTLTGGPANLALYNPASRRQAVFSFTPGLISVDVGSKALVWRSGTTWQSGGTTMCWGTSGSGTPTDFFFDGDSVLFDDTGDPAYYIGGSYEAKPSAMEVNNSAKDYFIGTPIGGPCQVTKNGSGSLKLAGLDSTYTGGTVVNAGRLEAHSGGVKPPLTPLGTGPVSIAVDATLAGEATIPGAVTIEGIVTPNESSDNPLGTLIAGPTVLSGTYVCQLRQTGCDLLEVMGDLDLTGSTLTLLNESSTTSSPSSFVIASYTGNLTGSFATVNGLPADYVLRYDSDAKQILVAPLGLEAWIAGFPGLGDVSATGDPDSDGISTILEYVLGGHPGQADTAILPQPSMDDWYFYFHYKRSDASYHHTVQTVQWTTDLENWTDIPVGTSNDGTVMITTNGDDPDNITIRILREEVDGGIYMRLKVEEL